ncbi:hypothetical protein [Deefgea rivuli]|uniref:hypothetical protein n=1 Tax=Deefgea rivuli TaxID=400948 RepID=UPI00402B6C60
MEDIELLIEHSLARINNDSRDLPEWQNTIISVDAKNILLNHAWPVNIRELYHTLLRAAIWSRQSEISAPISAEIYCRCQPIPIKCSISHYTKALIYKQFWIRLNAIICSV